MRKTDHLVQARENRGKLVIHNFVLTPTCVVDCTRVNYISFCAGAITCDDVERDSAPFTVMLLCMSMTVLSCNALDIVTSLGQAELPNCCPTFHQLRYQLVRAKYVLPGNLLYHYAAVAGTCSAFRW